MNGITAAVHTDAGTTQQLQGLSQIIILTYFMLCTKMFMDFTLAWESIRAEI